MTVLYFKKILQPLFMSSESEGSSRVTEQSAGTDLSQVKAQAQAQMPGEERKEEEEDVVADADADSEEESSSMQGRDCVVCQNAPVNRVLLPCRHTCVCDSCMTRMQHCPMCRAYVMESFALAHRPVIFPDDEEEEDEEQDDDKDEE